MSKDVRATIAALLVKMSQDMANLAIQNHRMSKHLMDNSELLIKFVESLEREGWPMPGPTKETPNVER